MCPPPLVLSSKELPGEKKRKRKLLQERKNILKTFNCNPDAICTPLVRPLKQYDCLLESMECAFGDVCAFGEVRAS